MLNQPDERPLGAGEASQGPTVAAIANAFFDATGVRIRQYPMSPPRVRAVLAAAGVAVTATNCSSVSTIPASSVCTRERRVSMKLRCWFE